MADRVQSTGRIVRLLTGPVPVALIALQGAVTIALEGTAGRGYTHRLLLMLVLAENVGALCFRRRHPVLALAGIMLTFVLIDSWPTTLPAVLVALLAVLLTQRGRTTLIAGIASALLLAATPAIHGDRGPTTTASKLPPGLAQRPDVRLALARADAAGSTAR